MSVQYTSFLDGGLTLPKANGDIDEAVGFATPNFDPTQNGVLSFEANPTDGTPTLTLSINGAPVYNVRYGKNVQRVAQENFSQSILAATNTLTIQVTGGSVEVSDCHVLYKEA